MGAPLTEFFLEFILREGLQKLRADKPAIQRLFEDFMDDYLVKVYGDDSLQKVVNYVQTKELHIVQSWPLQETRLPCCSINLLSTDENIPRDLLEDYAGYIQEDIDPTVIVDGITPIDYNNGFIEVPDTVNLNNVSQGSVFVDSNGDEFAIITIVNETGNKKIGIGRGEDITIGPNSYIRGLIDKITYDKHQMPLQERLILGIHAKDNPIECKYWYYVIMYLLAKNRLSFERKGLQIHTTTATDFNRALEYLPEGVFTRFININFLTQLSWRGETQQAADNAYNVVRVKKDVVEVTEDSLKSVITTED